MKKKLTEQLINFESPKKLSDLKEYADDKFKKIGVGSARIVYAFSDDYVLKIAKNKKGLEQNKNESNPEILKKYSDIVAKVVKFDIDGKWLIQERAEQLTDDKFEELMPDYNLHGFLYYLRHGGIYDNYYDNRLFAKIVTKFINEFDIERFDIANNSSWGVVNGRVVIVDYGMTLDLARKMYGVKYAEGGKIKTLDEQLIKVEPPIYNILGFLGRVGHECLIVGGAVRDAVMGITPKDIDIEVYNITYEKLSELLSKYGSVNLVGKKFGVIKFKPTNGNGMDYDFSVPRKENKIGVGHKEFDVTFDTGLTIQEAALRRDFSINALAYNPLKNIIYDFFGGLEDIENKVIRHTSDKFSEDFLRIFRAMQFQSRFDFSIHPDTIALMKEMLTTSTEFMELATERVYEEWKKWAEKGVNHSLIFKFMRDTGLIDYYPYLQKLKETPQDAIYHPEGDVEIHTTLCLAHMDKVIKREGIVGDEKIILVMSILFHDIAKPDTTEEKMKRGRLTITSEGHEAMGGKMCLEILPTLGFHTDLIYPIANLVANHLAGVNISMISAQSGKVKAVKKLSRRLSPATIKQLLYVMESDTNGRANETFNEPTGSAELLEIAKEINVSEKQYEYILMGRHLIEAGLKPSAKFGEILAKGNEAQENGEFSDVEGAKRWLKEYLSNNPDKGMNYNVSFQEMSRRGMELLAKQPPVTLEIAREQALWLKIKGSSKNKEEDVKNHLRMYYPDWIEEQIDAESTRLFKLYNSDEKFAKGGLTETEPLLVYHGTDKVFNSFSRKKLGSSYGETPSNKLGFFFTDNPLVAKTYGKNVKAYHLTIKSPYIVDAKGKDYSQFKHKLNQIAEEIDVKKYDSVIIKNYADAGIYSEDTIVSDNYIVFDTTQIELADGNNPDIRFADGGTFESQRDLFLERLVAAQKLHESLTGRLKINSDASVKVYHGTSESNKAKILESKHLQAGTYFSTSKSGTKYGDSPLDVAKRKFGKEGVIMEMNIFADNLETAAAGSEIYTPVDLYLNEHGVWDAENKFAEGGLVAPNGKPSNLTPEQYKMINELTEVDALKFAKKDWNEFKPSVINDGFCEIWAKHFKEIIGGEIKKTFASDGNVSSHTFIKYKNKYFDAEVPNGISDIMDLPYIKRWMKYADVSPSNKERKELLDSLETKSLEYLNSLIEDKIKARRKKFAEGGLVAPNGKPSKLTPEQYRLVRTPAFISWFGDWLNSPETASKVVDSNGEPLLLYHGTNKDFNIFSDKHKGVNTSDENTKFGYFFSKYIDEAKVYMREAIWKDTPEKYNELYGARIIQCFLNIKNPLIVGYAESNNVEKIESRIKEHNDGISDERGDFICFNSTQIKLADGSNTTFDGNNPDIRFADGGSVLETPKVGYHGTQLDIFSQPRVSKGGRYGTGFYLGTSIKSAKWFGSQITNSSGAREDFYDDANVFAFDLSSLNIKYYKNEDEDFDFYELNKEGYDGIYLYEQGEIVVFNVYKLPTPIKVYDKNNPDKKFAEGGLIAPNGKPSNLTPEQYRLVRTPAFISWFGDWQNSPETASKVIDENGEPLRVYRGDGNDFNVFDKNHSQYGMFYFTDKYDVAKTYTVDVFLSDIVSKVVYKGRVKEYFLNIRNLYADKFPKKQERKNSGSILKNSYDPLIEIDEYLDYHSNIYVAFEPTQIKLADGSNTTFNGKKPDVRFADGGLIKVKSFKTDEGKFSIYDTEKGGARGRMDMFTVLEDKKGWIVRNAFVPDSLQKQGIATSFYAKMNGESLNKTGKPLRSTQPRTLNTGEVVHELSKYGIILWDSLVKKGLAEKIGDKNYIFKVKKTLPKELSGQRVFGSVGFGGKREHTEGKVNLQDLLVLDNGIEKALDTYATDKSFKPSKEPIIVGVDANTGVKQLLDGYHRYISKKGMGQFKAKFIPMSNEVIISFEEADELINKKMKEGGAIKDTITLYHGTHLENANNLIKNGWQPRETGGGGNMGQPKFLYLTSEPENAMWYANENGGDAIVQVSDIPLDYLRPDPEDEAGFTMDELLERIKTSPMPANFVLTKPLDNTHFKLHNMKTFSEGGNVLDSKKSASQINQEIIDLEGILELEEDADLIEEYKNEIENLRLKLSENTPQNPLTNMNLVIDKIANYLEEKYEAKIKGIKSEIAEMESSIKDILAKDKDALTKEELIVKAKYNKDTVLIQRKYKELAIKEQEESGVIQKVIDWAKDPENNVKVIVAFSGGKDSVALVLNLFELGFNKKNIELWHHDVDGDGEELFDWKCTKSYCQSFADAFELPILFSYSGGGITREIFKTFETRQPIYYQEKAGGAYNKITPEPMALGKKDEDGVFIPYSMEFLKEKNTKRKFPAVSASLTTRWCSDIAKIDVMSKAIKRIYPQDIQSNILILTGERRAESTARSLYLEVEKYTKGFTNNRKAITWRSIVGWSEQQVWDIIKKYKVQPHPCYELGWGRCSCQLCIFGSANTWASVNVLNPEKIERIAEIEAEIGHTLYNEDEKIQEGVDSKGKPKFVKTGKKLNIIDSRVKKGVPFLTDENKARWQKEANGEFTSPIIIEDWKMPVGAFNGENCGAN